MMTICISRLLVDGEIVAQGLATPLVTTSFILARLTHAPNLYFASAIGQGVCRQPAPISLTSVESLWLDRSLTNIGFVRAVTEILPSIRPKEFFRPGQVDAHGNFNNIAFGSDYFHPRLRMPGTGGIPDVTTFLSNICLYVPRHSRVTFVPRLDFCAGLGHNDARVQGKGPINLISDLGLFDYLNGHMRLVSYHPGSSIEVIQKHTGFELEIAPDVSETPHPTPEELRLIRTEIDPKGIRKLETLSGSVRRELLHSILANGG